MPTRTTARTTAWPSLKKTARIAGAHGLFDHILATRPLRRQECTDFGVPYSGLNSDIVVFKDALRRLLEHCADVLDGLLAFHSLFPMSLELPDWRLEFNLSSMSFSSNPRHYLNKKTSPTLPFRLSSTTITHPSGLTPPRGLNGPLSLLLEGDTADLQTTLSPWTMDEDDALERPLLQQPYG
ncbi:hypothetical protein BDZ89DRAFT_1137721 [Hymenopellis radicata]|nr:hypothetical protein BDZ89DRAFT_1137721 [Hymenopellis radicata]